MDKKGCGEEAMESKDHFCAFSWSVTHPSLLHLYLTVKHFLVSMAIYDKSEGDMIKF